MWKIPISHEQSERSFSIDQIDWTEITACVFCDHLFNIETMKYLRRNYYVYVDMFLYFSRTDLQLSEQAANFANSRLIRSHIRPSRCHGINTANTKNAPKMFSGSAKMQF